jgi:5-methylcytosine-specific restriction protein A
MTKRKPLSRLQRVRIFDNAQGTCCICHFKIDAGRGDKWIVEHIKPLWLGGEDDERNMAPAHEQCAIDKTRGEAPVKAKSDRVRANYLGIRKPRNPMPGSRASGFRKRMDGTVERR